MRKWPLIVGIALLLAGTAAIVVLVGSKSGASTTTSGQAADAGGSGVPIVTLNCIGGSEKSALMADPQLRSILRTKYHLQVNYEPLGSYEQVELSTAQLKAQHTDCLWPSSTSAQLVFESMHTLSDFPGYRAQTVLESPEVIYAGPDSTAALVRQGVVVREANRYFIVNMKQLLLADVLKQRTWQSLGATNIGGPMTIFSTNPPPATAALRSPNSS